ncbi:MAG TPA: methyltransferase domain-containing protein [Candidatus Polarisedimenticolia bacterium]|nr:methyltransferase domain-containing protein [Candidatus Polarisedimenticolia bacterium]
MVVRRNFEDLYRREDDPWTIGGAEAQRYGQYLEWIRRFAPDGGFRAALDLGCGKGAFTARLARLARETTGVELSEIAAAKARQAHPGIRFLQGDVRDLDRLGLPVGGFDLIVASDVIAYLTPREADVFLERAARLLAPQGRFFLAAWSPGGRYFTPESLERLAARRFALLLRRLLPSRHAAFMMRRRRTDVLLTYDYETWQPVPEGKRVDWRETVIHPTEALLDAAERCGARLTFFVEMGEVLTLRRHDPEVSAEVESQLRSIRRRGHDLQLHLHPEWLPESSPRHDPESGSWAWDPDRSRIQALEENPESLARRLKETLEAIVRPEDPTYRVRAFRAGKYRIQPHAEIFRAFLRAGIVADSSVWQGGWSFEHRFDFRRAGSRAVPYFPADSDISVPAPPAEEGVLELPICSADGERLALDGASAKQLLRQVRALRRRDYITRLKDDHPDLWRRSARWLRRLPFWSDWPRWDREPVADFHVEGDDTLVAIGHTKAPLRLEEIESFVRALRSDPEVRFPTLGEALHEQLAERARRRPDPEEILQLQVERETEAVLGESRNEAQSSHLQQMIPVDRCRILDFGCGAGYWTKVLEARHGFCVGVDYGMPFLEKAAAEHRVRVARCDFNRLPFPTGAFDAVYADNVLEHSADPAAALAEIHRVLARKGMLAAALPPDARNRRYPVSDHLWKTDRRDLERRLWNAGFSRIRVSEVDTVEAFGMAPYPAAGNAMLYVTAWKAEGEEITDRRRAEDLMEFVYRRLDPSRSQRSLRPEEILKDGFAWCLGYCAVLGALARQEGIPSRYVTLEARDHPRGRGTVGLDTHELVELRLSGRWVAFDPMANRVLGGSVEEILADPGLADKAMTSRLADERFRNRGYHLYCSAFFYERVIRYCRRDDLASGDPWNWVPVRRPRRRRPGGQVRTLLLTDRPEADRQRLAEEAGRSADRIWTRGDLAALGGARAVARRLRAAREPRLEILSEDLAWHERAIRVHLLGAFSRAKEKRFLDRRGRSEDLGWWPLASRQAPQFLAGWLRSAGALGTIRAAAEVLQRVPRIAPRRDAARRPTSVLYLRSDLWRGVRAGGSVGHVAGMAEGFRREGYAVRFLAAEVPEGIDREAMPVHVVPPPASYRVSRSGGRFEHAFHLFAAGRQLYRDDPPGLLYHRFDEGSLAGVLLSRSLGIPLVLEYNGSGVWIADHWDRPLPHRGTFQAIEAANLKQAHLIVTVSGVLRDELVEKGVERHRILVCPNAVDADEYRPDRDAAAVRRRLALEGRKTIGFIGTFGPWHGAPILAAAAGAILRGDPQAALLWIGDGTERGRVEAILAEQGVADRCRFTGLVPQKEAPDFLAACDLFVSPHVPNPDGSRFFGSPTKLFEYMATGRGIVASNLEQIGEILEDGRTALLVPPGSPEALAEGILRLLRDPDLAARLGDAARRQAIARHSWERNARSVLDLVEFL